MKLKTIAVLASLLATFGFTMTASAQISGDVIRIGYISDMSGLFADIAGSSSAEAIRMAIADMGGAINGRKIEFIVADHQNKADIASGRAREWFDQQGVDLLIGGANASANLAMGKIANEKKKPLTLVTLGISRTTNEDCSPYVVQYIYNTVALARGTAASLVKQGGKSWYFLTADYAFGASLEKDSADVVKANDGNVLGSVKHPLNASDFSSFMLQAQASKAQILGLANAGGDTVNAIKAANEFGVTKSMKLAGLLVFINDIHALGLQQTQGMYLTDGWYWDLNNDTRAWAKRYFATMKKQPNMLNAGAYSAALTYLKAVKDTGTDDADKVMAKMKSMKINDVFTSNGVIRPDGHMMYDMHLMQVKSPAESKYPWDYYKVLQTIPGDQAYTSKAESKCPLWK
jgi:branched-chain amino acid transport system substrate-binding protein